MKIFVVGASGRVGQKLLEKLAEKQHTVYAASRHPEKIAATPFIKPVELDLHASVSEIAEKMVDSEVVYFVAGSRGNDLLQTDLFGAVKVIQVAEEKKIPRVIQLSAVFSLTPERWQNPAFEEMRDYNIAKFFADRWLMDQTQLTYTILQPGALTEEPGSGKVSLDEEEAGSNSIEDVAAVLAEILENPTTENKVIAMRSGDTDISTALKQL